MHQAQEELRLQMSRFGGAAEPAAGGDVVAWRAGADLVGETDEKPCLDVTGLGRAAKVRRRPDVVARHSVAVLVAKPLAIGLFGGIDRLPRRRLGRFGIGGGSPRALVAGDAGREPERCKQGK